jgi:glycosyltransferase involved in cell wall biosynthesis
MVATADDFRPGDHPGGVDVPEQMFVDVCGLNDRVRLYGPVKSEVVSELSRKCGVFVQHSLTDPETGDEEGLPTAIQEAWESGWW